MAFGRPKSPHEWPPGTFDGDAKSPATDGNMRNTSQIVAFQSHDRANFGTGSQHFANSSQVTQAFLTDVAGEQHIDRRDLARNPQQIRQLDRRGDGDAVVPDTWPRQAIGRSA